MNPLRERSERSGGGRISQWDTCRLRRWLNTDFLYAAFNAEERMRLATTDVPRVLAGPLEYGHDRPDTRDRVYLLSKDEVRHFFPTNASRLCDLVPRAKKVEKRGAEDWKPFCAAGVNDRGRVPVAGRYHRGIGGVRPVIVVRTGPDAPGQS